MKSNGKQEPELCFSVGRDNIRTMAYVSPSNAIAIADGADINIYSVGGADGCHVPGKRIQVFQKHKHEVLAIVHLRGDLVASIDIGGNLLTWELTYTKPQDQRRERITVRAELLCLVPNEGYATLMKLNDNNLLVSIISNNNVDESDDDVNTLLIVSHNDGRNLSLEARGSRESLNGDHINIDEDSGHGFVDACFVFECTTSSSCPTSAGRFAIWNKQRMEKMGEFHDARPFYNGAVSDRYIVLDSGDKLVLRANAADQSYPEMAPLILADWDMTEKNEDEEENNNNNPAVEKMVFITASLVMITTERNGIYFVDLSTKKEEDKCAYQLVARIDCNHGKNKNSSGIQVVNTILMADGRLCVVGELSYGEKYKACITILQAPSQVAEYVTKRAQEMYREKEVADKVLEWDENTGNAHRNRNRSNEHDIQVLKSELSSVKDELAMLKARYATQESDIKALKAQLEAVVSAQQKESNTHKMEVEGFEKRFAAEKEGVDLLKSQVAHLLNQTTTCASPQEARSNKKRKL